jgi:hypothetical protein
MERAPPATGRPVALTQRDYLLVTKPMRDPLAWAIHKMLVRLYFAVKGRRQQVIKLPAGFEGNRNYLVRSGRHGPQTGVATRVRVDEGFNPTGN